MSAYYNEFDKFAAQWLRNLIAKNLIAPGDVDERSICDVDPDDLAGYTQCHFFAGIGGWSLAARLAGWPDDKTIWTGSCPCQPFSVAGKGEGFNDERHLWPELHRLIEKRRPPVFFGEQVASSSEWIRCVRSDLEDMGYAVGAIPIEAASVGAPHKRDRIWIVADAEGVRESIGMDDGRGDQEISGAPAKPGSRDDENGPASDSDGERRTGLEPDRDPRSLGQWNWRGEEDLQLIFSHPFSGNRWPQPLVRRLDDGLPAGMDRSRTIKGFGNAIVPQVAAEVMAAYMECRP